MNDPGNEPEADEYVRRVLYSLATPVSRLAANEKMPIKEVTRWIETAYFHELKGRNLKMREIASSLDVSMRKVANLSHQLKVNFLSPEREVALPRQIEFALWSEPLSKARLIQTIRSADEDEIERAVESLLEDGRIVELEGRTVRYDISNTSRRIVGRDWMGKIDGLNNLVRNLSNAVFGRFFANEEHAFARTLQLRVRPQDLGQLNAIYEEHVWEKLRALDEAARGDADAVEMSVSILWAPDAQQGENDE